MIILIDFENTHASGFQGVEYLDEQDTLVVYYSDENSAVTKGVVDDLNAKNVHVRMVKLLKQHSNALDMYIASTTGMFLDTGEKICIVSKDKGYAAVRDFWHSLRGAEILLGETIEECFLHSIANDDPRIRKAKERSQKALLTESFETMNKIPTRPTLSRNRFWRRGKQPNFDLSRNLDPVEILPNPLAKPFQEEEYTLTDNELENLKEFLEEKNLLLQDEVESLNTTKEQNETVDKRTSKPEAAEPATTHPETTMPEKEESTFVNSEFLPVEDLEEEINPFVEEESEIKEDKKVDVAGLQHEQRLDESSKKVKVARNQVRYVWDAVKKAMIKVEEDSDESTNEKAEYASGVIADSQGEEERDNSEVKQEKRRRNPRRRHNGRKKTEKSAENTETVLSVEKNSLEKDTEKKDTEKKDTVKKETEKKDTEKKDTEKKETEKKETEKKGTEKKDTEKKDSLKKKESKSPKTKADMAVSTHAVEDKTDSTAENVEKTGVKEAEPRAKTSAKRKVKNPKDSTVEKNITKAEEKPVEKKETELKEDKQTESVAVTDNHGEAKKKNRRRSSGAKKKQGEEAKESSQENDSH